MIARALLIFILLCGCQPSPSQQSSSQQSPSQSSLSHSLTDLGVPLDSIHLRISKANYELHVLYGDSLINSYPVVFGGNPIDDKHMQGDQCTPEGSFRIRDLYPHAQWSYFLWIDYPTEASWHNHRQAKALGLIPADANIGGEIGIHGVPEGFDHVIDQRQNWTLGCISLKNADVKEIYEIVGVGTRIEITSD
ncbi:MAG: L,D-transpeptidase [Bacteroidota bacterium]